MNAYTNFLNKVFSMRFAVQAFGVIVAIAIVATGTYIDHQQQDVITYQREAQLGRDLHKSPDPAAAFFHDLELPGSDTDVVDNSYSLNFPSNVDYWLEILHNYSHNRLIMFIDSSEGVAYSGKVNTLEKLSLENNVSLLAINYRADGPSDVEFFAAPGVTAAFTDQEAAALIRDKIKPALRENRLEYAMMLVAQQFSQEVSGRALAPDSTMMRTSHKIAKPGEAQIDRQDAHNLFDSFAEEAQHNTVNATSFLVILGVLALFLIWWTPSRYWGFIYGGTLAFAMYQALRLPSSDTVNLARPHTLFIPVAAVVIGGAAIGFFVDYLISRPANQAK